MKTLHYSICLNGKAGFSNLVMSFELGVVMAALTDRLLVLTGNRTPPANIVDYGGDAGTRYRSRVTDLIDLGVPWIDSNDKIAASRVPLDICDKPALTCVFYYPPRLSTQSEDFLAFARGRQEFITIDDELAELPALAFSGGPDASTLSFYSFFFYLDRAAQMQALDALRGMKPKTPYREFAEQVASDLGNFNAAHIRRGDFKATWGATTGDRRPAEAIASLDLNFRRDDPLVILTDEADDPFFDDIKSAYRNHIFIDHHILDRYRAEFLDLPMHDSIALAYISQLIAARSRDFIGTMTSTFTSLIQRMRGNLGLNEPFKFLWNELAPEGAEILPGSHVIGDEIPFDGSVMAEQFDGPYSWNRFNQRLNPAWMREWPEAFLDEKAMLNRTTGRFAMVPDNDKVAGASEGAGNLEDFSVTFRKNSVVCASDDGSKLDNLRSMFAMMRSDAESSPINRVRVTGSGDNTQIHVDDKLVGPKLQSGNYLRRCYREVVRCFIYQHSDLVWIHAGAAASDIGAIVLAGPWGHGKSTLTLELYQGGWNFMSDDVVPVEPHSGKAMPFPVTPKMRNASDKSLSRFQVSGLAKTEIPLDKDRVVAEAQPVSMFVFPSYSESETASLSPLSAGHCVGKLLENSLSFPENSDDVIKALCRSVAKIPAFDLRFREPAAAAHLLMDTAVSLHSAHAERAAG